MSKIIYCDYYVPSNRISTKELLLNSETFLAANASTDIEISADKYIKDTALTQIAIEEDADLIDIFSTMLTKMFEKLDVEPKEIKNIFYTSYENYDYNDSVSVPYYLQAKYKLSNAAVMTLHQHCSGTLQAIKIADSLNKNESGTYSLIISPCFFKKEADRYINISIMGDGAAIMLVGDDNKEGFKIMDSLSICDGYISQYCYEKADKIEKDKYGELKVRLVSFKILREVVRKNIEAHMDWYSDAKYVIVQNINSSFTKEYLENIGRFYENYDGGHIGDVDITRNLKDLMNSTKFQTGDKIVLFALGGDFKCNDATSVLCQYE